MINGMKPAFALEEPEYTQAQLLKMVPALTHGTLQNWISRGIINPEKPSKHAKVKWRATAVVTFRLMVDLIRAGLKASEAFEIAATLLDELEEFLDRFEMVRHESGHLEYILDGSRYDEYRQFRVIRDNDGAYSVREISSDPATEGLQRFLAVKQVVSIVVEVDIVFALSLNSISRLRAGLEPTTGEALN